MEFPLYTNDDDARERAAEDARELRAVRVLDAWAEKAAGREWSVLNWEGPHATCCLTERYAVRVKAYEAESIALARIAAAEALAKEDPSLLEGI